MTAQNVDKGNVNSVISTDFDIVSITVKLITPILIVYLALKPTTAIVLLIDYFKVDPGITQIILMTAMPILIGITLARGLYYYSTFMLYQIEYALLLSLKLINMSDVVSKIVRKSKLIKTAGDRIIIVLEYMNKNTVKSVITTVIAVIACILIFILQFDDNVIGRAWNYKFNKNLEIVANLHYNCQVTGAYNDTICSEWKLKRQQIPVKK